MARLLGEARVAVLPDGTRFKSETEATVKKATAGITAKIPLTVNTVEFQAKVKELKAKLDQLRASSAAITIDADDKKAVAKLASIRAKAEDLARTLPKLRVDADIIKAEAKLAKLDAELDAFSHKRVTATANVDTNRARRALNAFTGYLEGDFAKKVSGAGNGSGNKFGNGFISGLGKSALMQNPGITAAVIAGLAALPAAIGAAGVLGGIALGGGIVAAAIISIKKDLKNATTQLKAATTKLASDLKAGASKAVIQQDKQTIASLQQQIALLNKEAAAFAPVTAALSHLKQSFYQFAIVVSKPLIKPFTDALNYLSRQLNGPLRESFTGLFKAVGPLVKPVVTALTEIVRGILPGLTSMLNKARGPLGDLFVKFGKIVGLRIGDWFRAATPYIKASSDYFLKLVDALGKTVTWLIKFGGETAKAFGGSQFQGFGKIISQIGNDLLKIVIPAFEGWSEVMAPVIKDLALIALPLLNFLAKNPALVKAIAAIASSFYLMSKAVLAVNIVLGILDLELTPIGALFVGIAAAVAIAAILIVKYWKPISAFFVTVWKHIWSGFIGPLINFFTETIPHAFSVTVNWLKKNWPMIVSIIGGPMAAVAVQVVTHWNQIFGFLKSIWGHIENTATGIFKPIASVIVGVWNEIYKVTRAVWGGIWAVIKPIVLIILGLIGEAWIGIRNLTIAVWHSVYDNIVHPMAATWTWLYRNFLTPVGRAFRAVWDAIYHATVDTFSHVYHYIVNALSATWNWVYRNFLTPIARGFRDIWNAIYRATTDTFSHVYHYITDALSKTWSWVFRNFLQPVYHGFINTYTLLKGWTQNTFNWIHDHILNPLTKAWGWIKNTFVIGVQNAFRGLVNTVKAIWNGLKGAVAGPVNFVIDIWNKFAGFVDRGLAVFGIKKGLNDHVGHIRFAKGGHVPGYAPGKDVVPAMLSPGEFVIRPEVVKNVGVKTLHALNESGANPTFGKSRPYIPPGAPFPGNVGKGDRPYKPGFADGGTIERSMLNFMMSKRGQPYSQANRWGEPPWDCSSLVWEAAHHAGVPIPKSQAIANLEANWFRNSAWAKASHDYAVLGRSQTQPGDIVFSRGAGPSGSTFGPVGHVGMVIGPDQMISALGSRYGVTTSHIDGFQGAIRLGGPGGKDILAALGSAALGGLSFILKPIAQLALNGLEALVKGAVSRIPGKGPIVDIAKKALPEIIESAKNKITGNQNNYDTIGGGGAPPGGATGSVLANGREMYSYLLNNLFSGHKVAAAGAIASIYGESGWNPYAQGTGGRGLIGWTPPGTISDAAFRGGMRTQLPEIIHFVQKNHDMGVINQMNRARSVEQAAWEWGRGVERFGIPDVHPFGIRLATQIMNGMANGGLVKGKVFDRGGTLSPGLNTVYNLTGKPEHVVPSSGNGQDVNITLEFSSGGSSDFDQLMLTLLRKYVRVKGAGNVQKAFGRH